MNLYTLRQLRISHQKKKKKKKKRIFYCESFGSRREPSSDCDHDLTLSRDLDCLQLVWLLVTGRFARESFRP